MSKIFISYRRKESADITGRIFDRLTSYFGPDCVFMDVDVLISGADYRTQIGSIIEDCDVLLAIIGQEWTTITDDTGQRRLDNPDDQLRIEIATAFERKIAVVPILVHDAALPAAGNLPEDVRTLASRKPVQIQSGLPFNADAQKLIDSLEQQHGLRHPDRRFPLELILIPLGIIFVVVGVLNMTFLPRFGNYINPRLDMGASNAAVDISWAGYCRAITNMILFCTIPLGLGPLFIVLGKRWCCVTKDCRRERLHLSSGIGRRPTPKSGTAVFCLACGLASMSLGAIAAIPAPILGLWSFLDVRQRRGWVRGRSLAVIGLLLALVGGFGTTYYLHLSYWRFGNWLRYVDQAEKAAAAGATDEALADYQRAKEIDSAAAHSVELCELKRAELYAQSMQYQLAIAELTNLIDRHASITEQSTDPLDQGAQLDRGVLYAAYDARAEVYDALGENDKAEEDRRRGSQSQYAQSRRSRKRTTRSNITTKLPKCPTVPPHLTSARSRSLIPRLPATYRGTCGTNRPQHQCDRSWSRRRSCCCTRTKRLP